MFKLAESALVCFALSLLLAVAASGAPDAQTPGEQEVLRRVLSGQEADLTKLPEGQRTLRADFLKQLLSEVSASQVQGGSITIIGAEISDPLSAGESGNSIDVPLNVRFERCHFAAKVTCEGCHFHASLSFTRCQFDDEFRLADSQVDGDLLFLRPMIRLPQKKVGHLFISGAHVNGKLSLLEPNLAGGSIAAAEVTANDVDVNLTGVRIGELNLSHLNADHLSITSRPGSSHLASLWLTGANLKTNLNLEGLAINNLVAPQMTIGSRTILQNVAVANKLTLSSTTLDSLLWTLTTSKGAGVWPKEMVLDDFTFKSGIVTQPVQNSGPANGSAPLQEFGGENDQETDVTLEFLQRADFSQSAFNSYEDELDRRGETHEAEDVFIEMHRARRRHDFKALNPATWLTTLFDYFQEYVLGYGRSAVPPLVWSVVFIALGTYFFRRRDLMASTDEKAPAFSPFWYSLEMFLPIVDLGVAKSWRPRASSFLVTYARIHQIAGWVLIPVALAAITGAVK